MNYFSQWGGPCRFCGKRVAVRGTLCRRDRRRLAIARAALAPRPWYVRAWRWIRNGPSPGDLVRALID